MTVDPAKTYNGKPCKRCGGTLRFLDRHCVECRRIDDRKRYYERYATDAKFRERRLVRGQNYRDRNRDKLSAYQRAYRAAHPDKDRRYYEANREKVIVYQRAYREANREKIAARSRTYYETNRDQILAKQRAHHEARVEQGLCAACGQPRLSEWFCWDCLNKKQFGVVKRQAHERGVDAIGF